MKIIQKIIIILSLFTGFGVSIVLADVPIAPLPTQYVECLCVTQSSQTCVTRENSELSGWFGHTVNSSCINNVYSANDRIDEPIKVGNIFTAYSAPGNGKKYGIPVFPAISKCEIDLFSFVLLGFTYSCTPLFPGFLPLDSSAFGIGSDTGVPCKRAGEVTGTLHQTGYIGYPAVTTTIGNMVNGEGLSGCNGLSGGCAGSPLSLPGGISHKNFSCY